MTSNDHPSHRELEDARLAAFALGELSADEHEAVARETAASAEAGHFIRQTRTLADHVRAAARAEALPAPSPDLRAAVLARLDELEAGRAARAPGRLGPWASRYLALALAAAAILAGVSLLVFLPRGREVAMSGSAGPERTAGAAGAATDFNATTAPAEAVSRDEVAVLDDMEQSTTLEMQAKTAAEPTGRGQVVREELAESNRSSPKAAMSSRSAVVADQPAESFQRKDEAPAPSVAKALAPSRGLAENGALEGARRQASKAGVALTEEKAVPFSAALAGPPGSIAASSPSASARPLPAAPAAAPVEAAPAVQQPVPGLESLRAGHAGQQNAPANVRLQQRAQSAAESYGMYGAGMGGGLGMGADAMGGTIMPGYVQSLPQQQPSGAGAYAGGALLTPSAQNLGGLASASDPLAQTTAPGTERYERPPENDFVAVGQSPLSTFSIDVDTASYANVRRFLQQGSLPPPDAVRLEEMVNYFDYDYAPPADNAPFAVHLETAQCPWNPPHRLLRVGIKGRQVERDQRGPSNLVFLIDVSGSMTSEDKLPLVKEAMRLLVRELGDDDRVALVTYASTAAVVLESTNGRDRAAIVRAIDALAPGGSTNGAGGIQLAYEQAARHFVDEGTNRVILATDGDLNVGITDDDALVRLITEKAAGGVFLTVLGVGTGNLQDAKLEKLADHGNGVYAYLDSLREARRVLVEQMSGNLVTIAKDVKLQIEFNPAEIASYRLLGYENRALATEDFADDAKDAGEIGAGHTATALYELVPAVSDEAAAAEDGGLKYQQVPKPQLTEAAASGELATLRLRYKEPDGDTSRELDFTVEDAGKRFGEASPDFQFAAAVASFGMILANSAHRGEANLAAVEEYAASALGNDPLERRAEMVDLIRRAHSLGLQ